MKVELLTYTPNPERAIASAARLCYSEKSGDELFRDLGDKQVKNLVRRLREMRHFSTFEHATFTFAISGVSRVLTHQLVRHRIASYSQRSQRYVKEDDFEYIVPYSIANNAEALEIYREIMEANRVAYSRLAQLVDKEDARYILPNATETKIMVTMNARALLHFFELRCCTRAQKEIRDLANAMLKLVQEVAPTVFENAGATCVSQRICHEGDLSCGLLEVLKAQDASRG